MQTIRKLLLSMSIQLPRNESWKARRQCWGEASALGCYEPDKGITSREQGTTVLAPFLPNARGAH